MHYIVCTHRVRFSSSSPLTIIFWVIWNCLFLGQSHLPAPELDELFGERNITVSLQYTEDVYNGSGYSMALSNISIEVTPPVTVVSNGTCFELILFYNIRYNISASITLCEFTGPSTTSELFYGKISAMTSVYVILLCTTTNRMSTIDKLLSICIYMKLVCAL